MYVQTDNRNYSIGISNSISGVRQTDTSIVVLAGGMAVGGWWVVG